MSYTEGAVSKYLDDLAARLPAPGGGSAAALAAGLGASLISMVLNFTVGKPKYAAHEAELKEMLSRSEKLRREFLALVDLDVQAYQSKNMRDALDVPFMLCRLCFEGMKLLPPLVRKGNVNLISDTAIAAILLEGAFQSAYYNVQVNLKSLNDKELTRSVIKELSGKARLVGRIRSGVEGKVGKIIRG